MRSHNKTTDLIEEAINEIIANKDNISTILSTAGHLSTKGSILSTKGGALITEVCKKHNVIENSVRVIMGW